MDALIDSLVDFNDKTYRNTIGLKLPNPYDDLSDDPLDWEAADEAVSHDLYARFSIPEVEYNAIGYVFDECRFKKNKDWGQSRFSDGTFPVWYGSVNLETTFYETVYHWKRFLLASPSIVQLAKKSGEDIQADRTVFNVDCQSSIVDLRNKTKDHPFLILEDDYKQTQSLGLRFSNEGMPGLITQSARYVDGQNMVIFNKGALKSPLLYGDFKYTLSPDDLKKVGINNYQTGEQVLEIK